MKVRLNEYTYIHDIYVMRSQNPFDRDL